MAGKVITLICERSCELTAEHLNGNELKGVTGVNVVKYPCSGMIQPLMIEAALKAGADGVVVTGCEIGDCYYREGNRMIRERLPDLVLLDYNMPELNGLDTLSRLRTLQDGTRSRVIIVSGSVRTLERWPFAVLGVQDFYDKSGGLPPLVELIGVVADQLGLRGKVADITLPPV